MIEIPRTSVAEWLVRNYYPKFKDEYDELLGLYYSSPSIERIKEQFFKANLYEALTAFAEAVEQATKESCQDAIFECDEEPSWHALRMAIKNAPSPIKK